jgi:hypothetical protein
MIWSGVVIFALTSVGLLIKIGTLWVTTRFRADAVLFLQLAAANELPAPALRMVPDAAQRAPRNDHPERGQRGRRTALLLPAMRMIPNLHGVLLIVALCLLEPVIAIGSAVIVSR